MKVVSCSAPPARLARCTAALVAAALVLGGCANYIGLRSDKQPARADSFDSAQSLPTEGGTWPTLDWAAQFGDPQLPQLIDEALADSPTIAQAQARLAKAASYVQGANASTLPKADAKYTWTRELYSGNALFPPPYGGAWYSENNVLASATYELDLWGKNREALRSAISQEKVAAAEAQQARLTLATSVARAYNQLAQLYALREVAQREISNRADVGAITRGRLAAGLDTEVERRTAEGNIATSKASLTDLDGQITTTRYQLGTLLGKGPDRGLRIATPRLGVGGSVALPANLPADLLSRRPDIVAARWQVEAAMHDIKVAKAEFFPDINLSAGFGFDAFGWGRFLQSGSRQIQAGPALHLPIFDGGTLRANLKSKLADYDSAVANYNQTLIGALNDVATQVAAIRSVDQQRVDAQAAYDASKRAYELAVIRYKAGLAPQLQVLSADSLQLAQQQTMVNLTMRRRDLQLALIKALGGGFDANGTVLGATEPAQ
ncbi:efflux transporter outer membrane subunit [Mycetohabitans rhizoxinica]|uniref:efflux transporter outer membrane subunit n=1 Tax=Mycetohabitans rhizoxinica TaxID=412963 RepID=UPI0030D28020